MSEQPEYITLVPPTVPVFPVHDVEPLPDTYHQEVVLRFLIYTMPMETRRRLSEAHPVSYDRVVRAPGRRERNERN